MIISILIALIYALINFFLGFTLIKFAYKTQFNKLPNLAVLTTGFLLGEGILSVLWMLLGLIGYFKLWVILVTMLLIIIFSWPSYQNLKQFFTNIIGSLISQVRNLSILWKTIFALTGIVILLFGVGALLLPPTGDAESFYMVIPKIMAGTGRFMAQPNYYEFSQIGFFGEMHLAALMVLNNFLAAKFFIWLNALCAAGLLIAIGNIYKLQIKGRIILLIILFSSPTFTNYITDGKVDIFSAALGLAGYYWVLQIRNKNWFASVLAGLFLGFAVVAKLSNALVIPAGFVIVVFWNCWLDFQEKSRLVTKAIIQHYFICVLIMILCAGLAFLPHLIKNKIIFGNPWASRYSITQNQSWLDSVWSKSDDPAADNPQAVLNSADLKSESATPLIRARGPEAKKTKTTAVKPRPTPVQVQDWPPLRWLTFLLVTSPLAFTVWTYPGKGGNLSILVLAFLPFLFYWRPTNYLQKQIITMALVGILIWLIVRSTGVTPRYILATLLLILPWFAAATEKFLERKNSLLKITVVSSLIFILIAVFLIQLFVFQKNRDNVCDLKPKALYGPNCNSLNFLNQRAVKTDRVFLVGYNSFYLRPSLLVSLDNTEEKLQFLFLDQTQPWEYLYNHGFTYIVIQKEVSFGVMIQLKNDPKPDWLNIQKIYSDEIADIYSIEKK